MCLSVCPYPSLASHCPIARPASCLFGQIKHRDNRPSRLPSAISVTRSKHSGLGKEPPLRQGYLPSSGSINLATLARQQVSSWNHASLQIINTLLHPILPLRILSISWVRGQLTNTANNIYYRLASSLLHCGLSLQHKSYSSTPGNNLN